MAAWSLRCDGQVYEGTLSMRGNDPHAKLVLMASDGKPYELTGSLAADLVSNQYRYIVLRGIETTPATGPGFPAKIKVLRIINIRDK